MRKVAAEVPGARTPSLASTASTANLRPLYPCMGSANRHQRKGDQPSLTASKVPGFHSRQKLHSPSPVTPWSSIPVRL